jgi:class 3 adenylate cyclase
MSESRKLVAILVADVVGYSRLAGADEDRILARLRGAPKRSDRPGHHRASRRIVKRTGDGVIGPHALTCERWSDARTASTTAPTSRLRSGRASTPLPRQPRPRVDNVGA